MATPPKFEYFTEAEAKSKIGRRVIFNPSPEHAPTFNLPAGAVGTVTKMVESLAGGYYLETCFEELSELQPHYSFTKTNFESGLAVGRDNHWNGYGKLCITVPLIVTAHYSLISGESH